MIDALSTFDELYSKYQSKCHLLRSHSISYVGVPTEAKPSIPSIDPEKIVRYISGYHLRSESGDNLLRLVSEAKGLIEPSGYQVIALCGAGMKSSNGIGLPITYFNIALVKPDDGKLNKKKAKKSKLSSVTK